MRWDGFVLSTMEYFGLKDTEPEIFFYKPEPERLKNDPVNDTHEVQIRNSRVQGSFQSGPCQAMHKYRNTCYRLFRLRWDDHGR